MTQETLDRAALMRRFSDARIRILRDYPFFGRLLLTETFGVAACGTAFTDTKRIVFDPDFLSRLSDAELDFVILHEVMHGVLGHCFRGEGKRPFLFNIACDLVVNSLLLEMLGVTDFPVDGENAMHLLPNGSEGRQYTAEKIYELLYTYAERIGFNGDDRDGLPCGPTGEIILRDGTLDTHVVWDRLPDKNELMQTMKVRIREASKSCSLNGTGIPACLTRYAAVGEKRRVDWRSVLREYLLHERGDYSFSLPDKRFQDGLILPSYIIDDRGNAIDRVWTAVDASGSVSDEALSDALSEIAGAIEQLDRMEGELSFFDTEVSEPVPFSSEDELRKITPVGGGGTSFNAVFRYLRDNLRKDPPSLILILTDGYAVFPEEAAAEGIPVIWLIINSTVEPPWGQVVHVD